jgi:hypothetical protein
MPVSYRVDGAIVVITFTGTSGFDDVQGLASLAASDPRLVPGARVLVDARNCRDDVPQAVLQDHARFLASLRGRLGPSYAIVTSDTLRFGLARMFEAFADLEGLDVGVFKQLEHAREWLASRPSRARSEAAALPPRAPRVEPSH